MQPFEALSSVPDLLKLGTMGGWGTDVDTRPIMSFVRVVGITSTVDTPSDASFLLSDETFPRLGLGLVDENPARDPLSVIGGPRLERRLI